MPQETKSHVDHGIPADFSQGMRVDARDPKRLKAAIEIAANYRGDVSITRISSGAAVEGYLFDHRLDDDDAKAFVRMIPKGSDERLTIAYTDIAAIEFTGRDTAAGRSFETWMRQYVKQKLAGETAGIEAESLDDS